MSLLNHLFGDKKAIAQELGMDDDKRIALWQKHLSNFAQAESLSEHFLLINVDKIINDFDATANVLNQIESLTSSELVSISGEEKTDEEILKDLEELRSQGEIEKISEAVVHEEKKQEALLKLFLEIHKVLKTKLHLIRAIRRVHQAYLKEPKLYNHLKKLLVGLAELINWHEAELYRLFREECHSDKSKHERISRLVRAVILEQEFKEEMETAEEKFARKMLKQMALIESKHEYRILGEAIFDRILEIIGAPFQPEEDGEQAIRGLEKMEKVIGNDKALSKIITKLKPRYSGVMVRATMLAFRQAYDARHFEELESGLVE